MARDYDMQKCDFIQSVLEILFEREDFDPDQKEYRGYDDVLMYEADACSYFFGYEMPHKNDMIDLIKEYIVSCCYNVNPDDKVLKYLDSIRLSEEEQQYFRDRIDKPETELIQEQQQERNEILGSDSW
jgi:hypothetical protein